MTVNLTTAELDTKRAVRAERKVAEGDISGARRAAESAAKDRPDSVRIAKTLTEKFPVAGSVRSHRPRSSDVVDDQIRGALYLMEKHLGLNPESPEAQTSSISPASLDSAVTDTIHEHVTQDGTESSNYEESSRALSELLESNPSIPLNPAVTVTVHEHVPQEGDTLSSEWQASSAALSALLDVPRRSQILNPSADLFVPGMGEYDSMAEV